MDNIHTAALPEHTNKFVDRRSRKCRNHAILLAVVILNVCGTTVINGQTFEGGDVTEDTTLRRWDSPFYIREDIFVKEDATLTIESGVELRFSPRIMLAVNGTLIATGTPSDRIKFTMDGAPTVPEWPDDIRLVDDRSVSYGRLQVLYQGRWRGVCANAVNWTDADTTVACRHLGFDHGNFSFLSWARNDSTFMLYHQPNCNGDEMNILNCKGSSNIEIGDRICKHQQTIHLDCYNLAPNSPAHNFWWGLEFYNASTKPRYNPSTLVRINESESELRFVDIEYAGLDPTGMPVPAIRASPTVPHLIDVLLQHCALDATNFTEVLASTIVHQSTVTNNRGHGVVVETHLGRVSITDSSITANKGNGVKTKFLDGNFWVLDEDETFCRRTSLGVGNPDVLPLIMTGIPIDSLPQTYCQTKFETLETQRITFSILEMDIEPEASAIIEVYDWHSSSSSKLIGSYPIINGTMPQGVTSTQWYLFVKFSWVNPPKGECPTLRSCVKFTFVVDVDKASKPEFYMNNTLVANNTQHGIYAENIRNFIKVNASQITHNQHGAGLRVFGGAGDIQVNATILEHNQDNGVNITYDGGWRIFNRSSFSYNLGNGVNVTLNETSVDNKTRYARQQLTEVSWSNFTFNDGYGVRVGNCCVAGKVTVNDSRFIENSWDGVEVESCFRIVPMENATNFTMAWNIFEGNYGHAVRVTPMINMVGIMTNNTFRYHPRHTFLIDNTDDFLKELYYSTMYVDYKVIENDFTNNEGFYVIHLRLTQGSIYQKLDFNYNRITSNNIQGAFPTMNARFRAYGVVVLSSSNLNFKRNHLENPASIFELTTHLLDQSATIQAEELWWGTRDYEHIFYRIFDRESRYDLPDISYWPSLSNDHLYTTILNDEEVEFEQPFQREDNIGGKLNEEFRTAENARYTVDKDISVMALGGRGKLILSRGTVLEIDNAIGIFVQGFIETQGTEEQPVIIRMKNQTTYHNSTVVRLVDGPNELEGRLEVKPEGEYEWGTVCNEGWNIISASISCQMLGFVVHPDDWGFYDATAGDLSQPIWRSSVRCTELDMDVTMCPADHENDHSCNHTHDVYLRCKPPTWAGIHFVAKADSSRLVHTVITQAGLRDPTVIIYAPAMRIDYNTHTIEHITVINNVHDGIEIMKNDVYSNAAIRHSTIEHNYGNGVSTRGSFFEMFNCTLRGNRKAGFEYNPHYTTYEARELRTGIHEPVYLEDSTTLHLGEEAREFVVTKVESITGTRRYILEISVDNQFHIVMDLIDYTPDNSRENVTVYDSRADSIDQSTRNWKIEDDLPDFPVQSMNRHITIYWDVAVVTSGRFAFVVRSKPNHWKWPFAELRIKNTTTAENEHGMITRHYNQPSNEYLDLFFRYRWETIEMYGVTFENNLHEALHVPSITKYHELYLPTFEELQYPEKISEIAYSIDSCLIRGNGGGVIGEHNHVEFSNNVWIWEVTNNHFEANQNGGFMIELPKVNMMYTELYNHSVDINDTIFETNVNFEFRIDGFYCNSSIARNRFQGNVCKMGCITISGTEKDFEMYDNEIVENEGKYMFEINMDSHTPYTRWVDATIMYNNFRRNVKLNDDSPPQATSTPTTYTMGIKGVQNITINRNLFDNDLDFELVGGYASSSLENYLDVTCNWWGTANQEEIQLRIFDIDDWNNYAIAEYYPHLTGSYYDAPPSDEGKLVPVFEPNEPLGGRIEGHIRLENQGEPYIVNRDLTIMPTGSLVITRGVELQFYPNVGILVLGSMSALGDEDERVKFSPVPKSNLQTTTGMAGRRKRKVSVGGPLHGGNRQDETSLQVRLNGGESPEEGFIEIYNSTERRWALVCDFNFNERTAEVACKSMGMESSNAIVRRSTLYDHYVYGYPKMHEQLIEWFWRDTFICDGSEPSLETCRYKDNYNLYTCMEAREYVFMRCGPRNLAPEYDYWGNVRFSAADFEDGDITPGFSVLEYVDIYGAGILHEEKVAAVQAIHRSPSTEHTRITHCNSNAYDYVAPRGEFEILNNEIQMNNGYAFGGLILNGDSNYENAQSSFMPLTKSTIPYDIFGLVRMCTSEKMLHVKNRILLYYKYRFDTIDCLKIIRSKELNKGIGFRILQINIYNDTFYENAIELYNGEFFAPDMLIKKLDAGSDLVEKRKPYETNRYYDTMGIRVTASAAYGDFGFIAEVVSLPYSSGGGPGLGPGLRQRIADSVITDNEGGGFTFSNVGEENPAFIVESNRIQRNGVRLLNLTSPHIVQMFVQNSRLATVSNNYMVDNAGGIDINSTTTSRSDAIYFNITNNVITYNTHGEALHVEGHHFNGFEIQNNFVAYNDVGDRSVISMFGVRLNYTTNIMYNNTGQCILNASVNEQIDINQYYLRNSFHDNQAYSGNRSTIFLRSAKFRFKDNFFQNPWNIHEMVTFNRTKHDDGTYPEVEAAENWWGHGSETFVAGRVWDRKDDDNLIGVIYLPAHATNQSVVEGRCYPGWRLLENNKCYLYFGGVVPYKDAELECKANRARVAWARDRNYEQRLGEIVSSMQVNYNELWRTWAYSEWQREGKCTVLINYEIHHIDCDENLPFICERDPYINPTIYWWPIQVALGVTGAVLFIVCLLCFFAYLKSKQRKYERLQRRTDLKKSVMGSSKASVYSNRGAKSLGQAMDDSYSRGSTGKRRRPPPLSGAGSRGFLDLAGVTLEESTDMDPRLDFRRPATPGSALDQSTSRMDQSSYFDSDLPPSRSRTHLEYRPPRLENEIPMVRARGAQNYDDVYYRNNAYDDEQSVASSRAKSVSSLLSPSQRMQSTSQRLASVSQYPSRSYSPSPRNPSLGQSEGNLARNVREKPPRPRPQEYAM